MTLPSIVSGVEAFQRSATWLAESAADLKSGTGTPDVAAELGAMAMTDGRDALRDTLAALGAPGPNPLVTDLGIEIREIGTTVGMMQAETGASAKLLERLDWSRTQALKGIALLHNLVEPTPKYT
jgi:hypothetical protein